MTHWSTSGLTQVPCRSVVKPGFRAQTSQALRQTPLAQGWVTALNAREMADQLTGQAPVYKSGLLHYGFVCASPWQIRLTAFKTEELSLCIDVH